MDIVQAVKNTLSGFVASGADKQYIMRAISEWSGGGQTFVVSHASGKPLDSGGAAELQLVHSFKVHFPDIDIPTDGFFPKVLTAANENVETVTAVFDILRQSRERGQWRDESFPAGLVFWNLKNKEHDKLRRQGYAIRKQREDEQPQETPQEMPKPAPVETAAFRPSSNGLDKINAALSGLGNKPA